MLITNFQEYEPEKPLKKHQSVPKFLLFFFFFFNGYFPDLFPS